MLHVCVHSRVYAYMNNDIQCTCFSMSPSKFERHCYRAYQGSEYYSTCNKTLMECFKPHIYIYIQRKRELFKSWIY